MGNKVKANVKGDEIGALEGIKKSCSAAEITAAFQHAEVVALLQKHELSVPKNKMEVDDLLQEMSDSDEDLTEFYAKIFDVLSKIES
eukprot:CAMPEP_0116873620 /NCGR_PEP_ID=MMETSP0463-20121206/4854_1 /TAXON_ID=181622 /ORGANISM="Strombidinopsis sp, Strain SopsisLIS2011" /LENGTH=86 /DNA_ID=CAMNT_0004515991 /DNA_START=72 /DNA_END=332 /DNA_ORIENTATION=-